MQLLNSSAEAAAEASAAPQPSPNGGLSAAAIAGIAVGGALAGAALVGAAAVFVSRRVWRQQPNAGGSSSSSHSRGTLLPIADKRTRSGADAMRVDLSGAAPGQALPDGSAAVVHGPAADRLSTPRSRFAPSSSSLPHGPLAPALSAGAVEAESLPGLPAILTTSGEGQGPESTPSPVAALEWAADLLSAQSPNWQVRALAGLKLTLCFTVEACLCAHAELPLTAGACMPLGAGCGGVVSGHPLPHGARWPAYPTGRWRFRSSVSGLHVLCMLYVGAAVPKRCL